MTRLATKRIEKNDLEKCHIRLFNAPCVLDDGCYWRKARGTVSWHVLNGCASAMLRSGAWECCKHDLYLHEVSVTSASPYKWYAATASTRYYCTVISRPFGSAAIPYVVPSTIGLLSDSYAYCFITFSKIVPLEVLHSYRTWRLNSGDIHTYTNSNIV